MCIRDRFITSVGAVIYPMLSKLSSEDNKEKFISSVVQSINSVILLVIPISVSYTHLYFSNSKNCKIFTSKF